MQTKTIVFFGNKIKIFSAVLIFGSTLMVALNIGLLAQQTTLLTP